MLLKTLLPYLSTDGLQKGNMKLEMHWNYLINTNLLLNADNYIMITFYCFKIRLNTLKSFYLIIFVQNIGNLNN